MANSKNILTFFTIFVLIDISWCTLEPLYDNDQSSKKFFDVGNALELSCKVTGDDEKASEIQWSKKHKDNLDGVNIKVEENVSKLRIDKTQKTDDGTYYCEYKDDRYDFEVIANILVKIKPSTDVAVVEGESLTLQCIGVGTKLKINWVFDENITDHVTFSNHDGLENGTLEIKHVDKSFRGNFTCEGRHDDTLIDVEKVVFSTAYVRVKDKYAALWPFILICIEVFILCAIILIYEKHRTNSEPEDSETEPDIKNGKN